MKYLSRSLSMVAVAALLSVGQANARDHISIVGSSTVYPFAIKVAETFGKVQDFPTPTVESTGTGGGIKLFCGGVGNSTPDIANASRPIKKSEIQLCSKNGVDEIIEVLVGYDGITLSNSVKSKKFKLTTKDIFLALAKKVPGKRPGKLINNPYKNWNEVNPSLPSMPIRVFGPPPTSGTRDAFNELVMEAGCRQFDWIKSLVNKSTKMYREVCHTVRTDQAFVEAGENDNLIVRKLSSDTTALGIFGYSFLEQNSNIVQASSIDGAYPTFDTIVTGEYPVSRPLYFYVKKQHITSVPGIKEYMNEFIAERTMGQEGYLTDKGMIPLSEVEAETTRSRVTNLETLPM